MSYMPRFAGMLVTGLLLTSGLTAHAADPSTLQPFKYIHTKITETTELVGLSDQSFTDLLTQLNQTYGTSNASFTTWITEPSNSADSGLSSLLLSHDDSQSNPPTDEPQPADVVPAGTDRAGELSGGVVDVGTGGGDVLSEPEPAVEPPTVSSATTLRLSELYPNTNNDLTDEFIEVQNIGDEPVSLKGWTFQDASGKQFIVSEDVIIEPGAYSVVDRAQSKIALNNDTETVRLSSPNGSVIDEVAYDASTKGSTLSRINSEWIWTVNQTPSAVNTKPVEVAPIVEVVPVTPTVTPVSAVTPVVTPVISQPVIPSVPTLEPVNPIVVQPIEPELALPLIKTLRISEIFPNTLGDDLTDEFIEIENTGTESASLQGWTLADASGKKFTFVDSVVIEPSHFFTAYHPLTKLSLNNDVDSVVLSTPGGEVIDQVSYSKTIDGSSLSFVNGTSVWTNPTPGTGSVLVEPVIEPPILLVSNPVVVAESPQSISDPVITETNSSSQSTNNVSINNAPDGALVNIEGQVLVAPGILGKQIFYVNTNGQGVQIYKNDAVFPLLQEGQSVRVNGEMSTSRDERRIKITATGSLEPLETVTPLQATTVSLPTISATLHGQFISTQGMIVSRSATEILLEDQGTQLIVGISDYANIDTTIFNKGDLLSVQGIIVNQTGSLKLKPRSQSDLEVIMLESPVVTATTISGKDQAKADQQTQALAIGLGTGVVLLAFALRKYHPKFNTSYVAKHTLPISAQTVR